jgi:hypothetical protein
MRALEFRTAAGLRFVVHPDRGFDVGPTEFQGLGLCWLPPNGLAGPWYYEGDLDDYAWLRVGLGGLFNTAGLVSIGTPQTAPTEQFGFTQRLSARYGTHDRIAITPASTFRHGTTWDGDRCTLWAEGTVRQEIAYGEHLVLERRYEADLDGTSFTMVDTVTNEGWYETPHRLLYHFNLGYPLLGDGARVLGTSAGKADGMRYSTDEDGGDEAEERWRIVTDPVEGFTFEGYVQPMKPDADGRVSVALVNRGLRPDLGGLGAYLRYDAEALPVYIAWRMMREGLYAIGFEPSTTPFGTNAELVEQGHRIMLAPGERRTYRLEFGILAGGGAIDAFAGSLPT